MAEKSQQRLEKGNQFQVNPSPSKRQGRKAGKR